MLCCTCIDNIRIETIIWIQYGKNRGGLQIIQDSLSELKKYPVMPLYDIVYTSLRRDIFKGIYKPGDRLVEEDISQKANISRTPVREALKRLAAEGLIEFQPKHGAVVVANDIYEIDFLWNTRIFLETEAVKIAANNMDDEKVAILNQQINEMKLVTSQKSANEISNIIESFNSAIISIANLRHLRRIHKLIDLFSSDMVEILMSDHEKLQSACAEHIRIAENIISRDADCAAGLTRIHLLKWKRIYLDRYFKYNK